MGRGLAMSAARRVRLAVSGEPVYTPPTLLKQSSAYDYERLSLSSAESRPTTTRPVRLGGKNRIRIAGLQGLLHTPSNLLSRLWASYGRLRETAKETNVSVYDLFVGNQMLMHVCATPMRSYKKKPPVPIPAPSKPQAVAPKRFRAGKSASVRRR